MTEDATPEIATPPFLIEMVEPIVYPRRARLTGDNGEGLRAYHLVDSVSHLVEAPMRYKVLYTSADATPDLLTGVNNGEFHVMSQRLRESIEPWLKDYEFIPTHVELSPTDGADEDSPQIGGGAVLESYWWLNCWRRLDLVDWDASDISMGTPGADSSFAGSPVCAATNWKRLALKAPPPEDEHFFGFAGIAGSRRYLSTALYRHLLSLDLKVMFSPRFLDAADWSSTQALVGRLNPGRQFPVF